MNIEDEQWVEHALIDYERKRCVSKILSINCKDAIPKGNNYCSDLLRLNTKVVLHSGDVVNRSFIYKAMPKTEARRKFMKESSLPRIEALMLTTVWPQMEKIRQEKEFGVERISPLCYGIRQGFEGFLLEDLSALGYKLADRTKLLDMDHAKLTVKAHAQLHALSLILIDRGELSASDFSDHYMRDHPSQMETLITSALSNLATNIEDKWEPEWQSYAGKLREFKKTALAQFVECLKLDESNVNALTHGDYWLANMMFRYGSDGSPKNVRLLDFQLTNYNNVGLDLQYFLNSSLNGEAQTRKLELVETYYNKFKTSLELYGYSGDIPTYERILECYKKANALGLVCGLAILPYIVQPPESVAQDLEEWAKELAADKGMACPNIDTEEFRAIMKIILKQGSSDGIL